PIVRSRPLVTDSLPPTPRSRPPPTATGAAIVTDPVPLTSHPTHPDPAPAPPIAETGASTSTSPPSSTQAPAVPQSVSVVHGALVSRQRVAPVAVILNAPA